VSGFPAKASELPEALDQQSRYSSGRSHVKTLLEMSSVITFQPEKINLSSGHTVPGIKVSEGLFLARVEAAKLFSFAPNPMDTENRKKLESSRALQEIWDVRKDVQRLFAGSKARNVPVYASYIQDVRKGASGITPPIILYSEAPLEVEVDGTYQIGLAIIPYGRPLIALDGETQLAARHLAYEREPETGGDVVSVLIAHGKDKTWARQAFHDLNVLGVRPNAAISIGMDARDPLTFVAREVERSVPFFRNRVNMVRRQLKSSDKDIVTITALRGACITFAEGIVGVRHGTRPVPVKAEDVTRIRARAIEWFSLVTSELAHAFEPRDNRMAAAPAVLAAIGALGHVASEEDDAGRRELEMERQLRKLSTVHWERAQHWDGIGGKTNPKGILSVGGSKEYGYAIFEALNDPTSLGGKKIRLADTDGAQVATGT
jgi:DGQHR domain-containing protein